MPAAQLYKAINKWSHERTPNYSHLHIQLALVNIANPSGACIAVVDSMRLSSMTFIQAPVQAPGSAEDRLVYAWRDRSLGPWPIRRLHAFLNHVSKWTPPRSTLTRPTYKVLCANQRIFNGIGTKPFRGDPTSRPNTSWERQDPPLYAWPCYYYAGRIVATSDWEMEP